MQALWAVYKREVTLYFKSFIGYGIAVALMGFIGFYFQLILSDVINSSMMGGGEANAASSGLTGSSSSPWSGAGDQSGSSLARDAGVKDVGSQKQDDPSQDGPFDQAHGDDYHDQDDVDSDDFDDFADFDDGDYA